MIACKIMHTVLAVNRHFETTLTETCHRPSLMLLAQGIHHINRPRSNSQTD